MYKTVPGNAPTVGASRLIGETVGAGVAVGVLGGVAMLAWLMLSAGVTTYNPLLPLNLIGATFRGPEAVEGGIGIVLYGAAVHFATSALFGLPFAALMRKNFPTGGAVVLGITYAMAVMALMTQVVSPEVNPVMQARLQTIGGAWVIGQALFGAVLGLAPWARRWFAVRAARPE